MKRLVFIISILVCFVAKQQAQNLIANGSFENYTAPVNCTGGGGGFDNYTAFPVNHVVDNWYSLNSPDYFSQLCSGVNNDGSPTNIFGYSQAKHGNNYVGGIFYAKAGDMKEYPYQQLSIPLQAGKIYCLSFYVSRADRITHAIKNIGAYFSASLPTLFSNYYVNATPQVQNLGGFITDTIGWTEIQGCFTAVGGEQFITIGNFNSNANTDTLYVGTNNQVLGANGYAYYYIDDVTLVDQSTVGVKDLSDVSEFVRVYPNPANDNLNFTFSTEKQDRVIELYDAIGNFVITKKANSNNLSLATNNLPNGIYFYIVKQSNRILKQDKIVIIK